MESYFGTVANESEKDIGLKLTKTVKVKRDQLSDRMYIKKAN